MGKVIGLVGSPRKFGNTSSIVSKTLQLLCEKPTVSAVGWIASL